MSFQLPKPWADVDRRRFLCGGAAGLAGCALAGSVPPAELHAAPAAALLEAGETQFQIACMTLPYSQFPLQRALTGIQASGYRYVAWGTTHMDADGNRVPVMPADAPPERAKELADRCRDLGLEPLMMFAGVYPEANDFLDVMKSRIRQAAAGGLRQVLGFGDIHRGDRPLWIECFRELGPIARDHGVLIVLKPHGGLTATGVMTAEIIREIGDEGVQVNYDAGNVMDYLNIDAAATLEDFDQCAEMVYSFCIKDHRNWPLDQDCGPGMGEIDHYRLLHPVMATGREMPLCCENIFAPLVARPRQPEEIDALARRAREFLELIIAGLQTLPI